MTCMNIQKIILNTSLYTWTLDLQAPGTSCFCFFFQSHACVSNTYTGTASFLCYDMQRDILNLPFCVPIHNKSTHSILRVKSLRKFLLCTLFGFKIRLQHALTSVIIWFSYQKGHKLFWALRTLKINDIEPVKMPIIQELNNIKV
jgi:hypothetical protein